MEFVMLYGVVFYQTTNNIILLYNNLPSVLSTKDQLNFQNKLFKHRWYFFHISHVMHGPQCRSYTD